MKLLTGLLALSFFVSPSSYGEQSLYSLVGDNYPSFKARFKNNYSVPKEEKPNCADEAISTADPLSGLPMFASFGQSFSRFSSCTPNSLKMTLLSKGRFSEDNCKFSDLCKQSLLQDPEIKKQVDQKLNKIIARDHAKNLLSQNLEQLERLEMLKKYAEKEFGLRVPYKCSEVLRLDEDASQCSEKYVSDAFEVQQEKCDKGLACYRESLLDKGVKSYSAFKKENEALLQSSETLKHPTNVMISYLKSKIDQKNILNFSKTPQLIDDLSNLVTSASFKKLGEEEKMKSIFRIFKPEGVGYFGDPVLGFDFNNNDYQKLKKQDSFKELMKLVNNKAISKSSFLSDFNKFRKKRAEVHLSTGSACSNAVTLNRICSEATKLANGDSVSKEREALADLENEDSGSSEELTELTALIGIGFGQKELNVLADANRCQSYGLINQTYIPIESQRSPFGFSLIQDRSDSSSPYSLSQGGSGIGFKIPTGETGGLGSLTGGSSELASNGASTKEPALGGLPEVSPSAEPREDLRGDDKLSHTQPNTNYNDYQVGPQAPLPVVNHNDAFSNFAPSISDGDAGDFPAKGSKSLFDPKVSADDRVKELLAKLADAEEKLAKQKADAKKDGETPEDDPKVEEGGDPTIKELKAQIDALRTQVKNKDVASAIDRSSVGPAKASMGTSSVSSVQDLPASRVEVSSASSYLPRANEVIAREPSGSSLSSQAASGTRSSRAQVNTTSSPLLSMTINDDGSRSTILPSGDEVFSLDGLSPEKKAAVLTSQLKDKDKKSILIEENGVIKEVSPISEDGVITVDKLGNLTINKIVRGKPSDKKFLAQKASSPARAPANAPSLADLKREEERRRVELQELKALTKKAVDKKK